MSMIKMRAGAAYLLGLLAFLAAPSSAATFGFKATAGVAPSLPQAVTDLTAQIGAPGFQVEGQVTLTWTSPDAYTPTQNEQVSAYFVRYATFSADSLTANTTAWWNLATPTTFFATPLPVGKTQTQILRMLQTGATYFFAVRSTNTVISALSPIDVKTATIGQQANATIANFPPPHPSGLATVPLCGQLQVSWIPLSAATYDFDRYRLFQSSQSTLPADFYDATTGSVTLLTSTGTRTTSVKTSKSHDNFLDYHYEVLAYDANNVASVALSTTIVSTQPYPVPTSASSLQVQGSSVTPSLFVSWSNPGLTLFKGGLLVKSIGAPLSAGPVDFSSYTASAVMGNGEVVAAWNSGTNQVTYADLNLAGGTTYQYSVFNLYKQGSAICYSAPATGSIILQPRPMAPAGVEFALDNVGFSMISWKKVEYFDTGAAMNLSVGGVPPDNELFGYNIYKSTCGAGGCGGVNAWTLVNAGGPVQKSSTSIIVGGSPVVKTYFTVRAVNNFSFESADSNTVDSSQNQYAVVKVLGNTVAQTVLSPEIKAELSAANNGGIDLVLSLVVHPEQQTGSVLRAIEIRVLRGDNGVQVEGFSFKNGTTQLSISNTDVSALGTAAVKPSVNADLDIFWNNGVRYLPMNGAVNPQTDTVTVNTSLTGTFQLRRIVRVTGFTFDPAQDLLPRVITPNGDGLNDIIFFNTKVDGVTGKMFDMRGAKVDDLKACAGHSNPFNDKCLYWDARHSGKAVHGGIYIYDLNGQGKHYTGTVVVAQ